MANLKELQEVSKDLRVLYVEDQEEIRSFTKSILENFFREVIVAENGEKGLSTFSNDKFDLIITDIQMPKMTGLEMIKEIRKSDETIPVIITTAFNDEDYFLDSIELGVDRYILKPLEPKKLTNALYAVSVSISNKKKAREYEQKLMQEKINKATKNTIDRVANSFPVGCIVYTNDDIRFINSSFSEIILDENLKKIVNKEIKLSDLFEKKDGYLSNLKDLSKENDSVIIQIDNKKRIFRINLSEVDLDGDSTLSQIYSFSDITMLEYQKNKIKNFNDLLQEVLFTKFKKNRQEIKEDLGQKREHNFKEEKKSVLILNDDEKSILRKSHKHKISAQEYIDDIDGNILDELLDIEELENELLEELDKNLDFKLATSMVSKKLSIYSNTIRSLLEFEDLSFAIASLANLLENIKDDLNDKKKRKVITILEAIAIDLKSWRSSVFVNKSALDIHYLDSSLFSSCVQIELELTENHTTDDDDEILELF